MKTYVKMYWLLISAPPHQLNEFKKFDLLGSPFGPYHQITEIRKENHSLFRRSVRSVKEDRSHPRPLARCRFSTTDDSTVSTTDAALLQCLLHAGHGTGGRLRIRRRIVDHLVQRITGRCCGFEVEHLLFGRKVVLERREHRGQRRFGGTFKVQEIGAFGQMKRWRPVRRWLEHRLVTNLLHASWPQKVGTAHELVVRMIVLVVVLVVQIIVGIVIQIVQIVKVTNRTADARYEHVLEADRLAKFVQIEHQPNAISNIRTLSCRVDRRWLA